MKFGAIYARSSLGKERQGDTVENQVAMIKEFVKRTNMDVIFDDRFIYEDDGESGFKTTLLQRPAMKRLLNDIDSGLISIVFFKGISRFARDSAESITTAKRLKNKGVRVISLEENYDSFRDEPTMFQIYAVMAEQESRKTSIRVSLGNKQKARNGIWASSIPPYGYTKIKDIKNNELKEKIISQGRNPKSLYPDENAEIVKRIFEMFVNEGLGRKKIVNWLNENNFKTNKGKSFQEKNVLDILKNEVYIGNIVYGKTRYEYIEDDESKKKIQKVVYLPETEWVRVENAHPPIVTKEIFYKAQDILEKKANKFNKSKRFNAAKHPLTGLLKCGKCGAPMICQKRANKRKDGTKLEYRYYVCSTYHKKGRMLCEQKNVRADYLEEAILKIIQDNLKDAISTSDIEKKVKAKNDIKDKIELELKNVDMNIQKKINTSKALLETRELYDTETFIQLNKEIQDEIKKLREQKEALEKELKNVNQQKIFIDVEKLANEFLTTQNHSLKDLRNLFHKLIKEVTFQDNEIKEIKMNYNLY